MIVQNKLLFKFNIVCILSILIINYTEQVSSLNTPYYGKFIGKLSELNHGVSGEVYAVDGRTIHLKDFTYDGEGPAAYFYVGNTKEPSGNGIRLRDERGSSGVIKRYRKKSITLTLPDGKTLNNIKWFSVWCDEFSVNFGDVKIPRNFDFPRPQKIDALNGVHKITTDNIVIVDAQTLLIPNLSYDGEAPDAKFWVGRGPKPSPQGIRVPDENGKMEPLRQYHRKTVVLTLPGDLTVFDIGHFGIWCEAFTVDFGHVRIPSNLNVPPSLKMLGVSPQKRARAIDFITPAQNSFLFGNDQQHQTQQPTQHQQQILQQQRQQHYQASGQYVEATTFRPQIAFRPTHLLQQQQAQDTDYQFQQSISIPHIERRNDLPQQTQTYFINSQNPNLYQQNVYQQPQNVDPNLYYQQQNVYTQQQNQYQQLQQLSANTNQYHQPQYQIDRSASFNRFDIQPTNVHNPYTFNHFG